MAAQDPLSELADIHLPGTIGLWPPAIGWWVLAGLLAATAIYCGRRMVASGIRRRKQSCALRELESCLQRYREHAAFSEGQTQAGLVFLNDTNAILRRVALLFYPRQEVAGLSGSQWLQFLDTKSHGNNFIGGPGQALGEAAYRRSFEGDVEAIYNAARRWIDERYLSKPQTIEHRNFRQEAAHD